MSVLKLRLLNVGHGDCILIQFPDESWAIIDCGEQIYPYAPHTQVDSFLANEQPEDAPIRFVLATHPDADHDGGILPLLQLIPREIHAVYYSGVERRRITHGGVSEEDDEYSFVKEAQRRVTNGEIRKFAAIKSQDVINLDDPPLQDVYIQVLWPTTDLVDRAKESPNLGQQHKLRNNVSVVLKIKYANCSIILRADIEDEVIQNIFQGLKGDSLNVIKAPHHGGSSSIIPWDIITNSKGEKYILISCPSYSQKHPSKEFLSSIPTKDRMWKIRCTGIASACADKQEPSFWPLPPEDSSFLPRGILQYESTRRSLLSIGRKGRTTKLAEHPECCLHNVITIDDNGKIEHTEALRSCDNRSE